MTSQKKKKTYMEDIPPDLKAYEEARAPAREASEPRRAEG
jgi:hypothetical protein